MWRVIENSYFWICYKSGQVSKTLAVRFLNPLGSTVHTFRFSFNVRYEQVILIDDGTKDDRWCRQKTNARLERERIERERIKAMAKT